MNKEKKVTLIAKTLRYMRLSRGVSQDKAAKHLGLSKASIGHFEHGRVDLTDERIETFLALYEYSMKDFKEFLDGKPIPVLDLKYECLMLLEKIDETKLRTVHSVLLGFVS
ncbi:MAG: helix-turn-helix domain-containing protein [Bdellovibrionales bacterium]|nr:helix-turn-helix domain-containing protein [Bdellovibrionales bacterium]